MIISLHNGPMSTVTCLARVESLTVLGVTFKSKLRFDSHTAHIIDKAARSLYGLKTLRAHGLTGQSLRDDTRDTLIARILYAAPAWWGFLSMAEKDRLQSSVNPSAMASYLETFKMLVTLLNPWNLIYLDLFVQTPACFVSPSST